MLLFGEHYRLSINIYLQCANKMWFKNSVNKELRDKGEAFIKKNYQISI